MSQRLLNIVIAIALIAVGFLIGKYESFPNYSLKKELDPISIISLIVNALIVLYFSRILTRRNEIDKKDKDIIISRLDKIIISYESLVVDVNTNSLKYFHITSFIKRNRTNTKRLCDSYKAAHNNFQHDVFTHELGKLLNDLNRLMTYTSPHAQGVSVHTEPVTIVDNVVTYTAVRQDEILTQIDEIINKLIMLQLDINSR